MSRLPVLTMAAVLVVAAADVSTQIRVFGGPGQLQQPGMPPPRDNAAPQTGTGRISGRVYTADTRAPLRRAQMTLFAPEAGLRRSTTTDAEGRYVFDELPAGRFNITATKGGYVSLQAGQRRPFEPGTPMTLGDGQALANVDIALPRGSVITGRVTDEFGEPLAGAQVQALRYRYMPGGRRQLGFAGGPFVQTDDLGQFRVYGLMPGEYVLSASMRSFAAAPGGAANSDTSEGFAPTFYPGTINPAEAQTLTVTLGQELTVHVALTAARMASVSGVVVNSEGRPIPGGFIMLRPSGGGQMMMNMMNGRVGGDGAFAISNVPPGEHVLEIRPEPRGPNTTPEFATMPITVASENISGLRITTGTGGSVRGRVIFQGTAPRNSDFGPLRVIAQPADPQQFMGAVMFGGANNGTVADDGAFALDGVNGEVLFRVMTSPAWTLKSVTADGADITDVPYAMKGSPALSDLTIVLTDKQTDLSGSVTDDRGAPLKDYVVVVLPAEAKEGAAAMRFTRTVRPDQEGTFRVRGLPEGRYAIAAVESVEQGGEWRPEFQERVRGVARSITLREGQAATIDLRLATGL